MMKTFKKAFVCFLSLLMMVVLSAFACLSPTMHMSYAQAMTYENYDFTTISDTESIRFVEWHNVDIPKKIENSPDLGSITSSIIKQVARNRDFVFTYNYDEMQQYAETIQVLVNHYFTANNSIALASNSSYQLQYNTVQDANGNWVTSGGAYDVRWASYNCYAYALHRSEEVPFYNHTTGQYQLGDMSGVGSFSDCNSIQDVVEIVEADLQAMGYSNISSSTSIPTITDDQLLICVRINTFDFHFMRYDLVTDAWYHKPGNTAVLKYNYEPNYNLPWIGEKSVNGMESENYNSYTEDIYFIKYDKNKVDISYSTYDLSYDLDVNAGKDSILEIDCGTYNKTYDFNITATSSIKVELYGREMNLIESYTGTDISFSKMLSNTIYYLKGNFVDVNTAGTINIEIIREHSHFSEVLSWEYYNRFSHRGICACGELVERTHVVNQADIQNNRAPCLECHAILDLRYDVAINNVRKVSLNGSYILPNGIIVLVEEDIEAYFAGTLTFYDVEEGPVIQ